MHIRIDYLADKNCFTELNESPRLRRQWQDVLEECRQTEAGPEERLRIALRVVANENTSSPYQLIAREVKAPRQRLKYALETGLQVSALDGLFWFGSQRIAADILRLRKYGMRIATASVDVYDNITGTTRHIPVYYS